MRILKALGIKPRRTIRMALWGGEEEGLLGSRAYAARHYAGDANAAAREKLAVYLNNDPGTGPIYGWYLEENPLVEPIFDAWLDPLKDLGMQIERRFHPLDRGVHGHAGMWVLWCTGVRVHWWTSLMGRRRLTEEVAEDVRRGFPCRHA